MLMILAQVPLPEPGGPRMTILVPVHSPVEISKSEDKGDYNGFDM